MTFPPPPTGPVDPAYERVPPARSGMAVAAMVLGIVGILTSCLVIGILLGLVGLILGVIALVTINRQPQFYTGKGFAITGIVTGALSLLVLPLLLLAILLPALGRAHELSNRADCAAHERAIMQACLLYANDNYDAFPVALPPQRPGHYDADNINGPAPQIAETAAAGKFTTPDAAANALFAGGPAATPTNQAGNIMANMWLLVLRKYTTANQFLCKSDPFASRVAELTTTPDRFYFQNFNAPVHPDLTYSYSFAYPWNAAPAALAADVPPGSTGKAPAEPALAIRPGRWWRNTTDSSLALMADIAPLDGSGSNPVAQTPGTPAGVPANGPRAWNSPNHLREGQNVGYADAHVEFARRPDIGQHGDNLFTENGRLAGAGFGTNAPNIGNAVTTPGTIGSNYIGGETAPYDIVMVPVANVSTGQRQ